MSESRCSSSALLTESRIVLLKSSVKRLPRGSANDSFSEQSRIHTPYVYDKKWQAIAEDLDFLILIMKICNCQ